VGRRQISEFSVREAFWVAPNAACNYFSTASIFVSRVVMSAGAVAYAMGCVDGSLSWSTMSSTSCNLSWNLPIRCSNSFMWAVIWAVVKVVLDREDLELLASCVFVLSSIFVILSIKSSTTFSRWSILFY
jgi:hypothetical protein